MLFRHRCDINRTVPVGTNGRTLQQLLATDVRSLFIPMSSRAEMENSFDIGSGYDVYFQPSADIKRGDQLVFDGQIYTVRAVQSFTKVPSIAHKHATATCEAF